MPKYKVGDKVVLRRDLTLRDSFVLSNGAVVSVNHDMIAFADEGLFVTIKSVEHDTYYSFDGCDYLWVDEMIEGLYGDTSYTSPFAEDTKTNPADVVDYEVGDLVVCVDRSGCKNLQDGKIYPVLKIDRLLSLVTIETEEFGDGEYFLNRFRKHTPPTYTSPCTKEVDETKKHEFQVGERVKCVDATDAEDFLELNQYYEVVELFPIDGINPPIIVVRLNDYENEQFYAHRFVHYDTSAVESVAKVVDNVIDMVHHPSHYTAGGIETLDYIKAKLNVLKDLTPFQSYCWGNVIKYLSRLGLKGDMDEDLDKAITYLTAMKGIQNE